MLKRVAVLFLVLTSLSCKSKSDIDAELAQIDQLQKTKKELQDDVAYYKAAVEADKEFFNKARVDALRVRSQIEVLREIKRSNEEPICQPCPTFEDPSTRE